jgi:hypothetical protein
MKRALEAGFVPSRPTQHHRAARNQARWLTEVGRLHLTKWRNGDDFPYLLRVPIFGKCQKKSWYQYIF